MSYMHNIKLGVLDGTTLYANGCAINNDKKFLDKYFDVLN